MARCAFVLTMLCALALSACSTGAGDKDGVPQVIGFSLPARSIDPQRIDAARSALSALACPEGCDPVRFEELRSAFDAILADPAKQASVLPDSQGYSGLQISSGDGSFHLNWTYDSTGDYNVDGEVNISDLTPLGSNLNKTADSPDWATAQAADGDRNGAITISDLTPLGANLFAQVSGFNIYGGDSPTGPWTMVEAVPFSSAPAGYPKQFSHDLGSSPAHAWYALAPFDSTGADAVGEDADSPGALVQLGESTVDSEQPIGSAGGNITAPTGSPIEGLTLEIPAGAFSVDTQVTLGHNDGTVSFEEGTQLGSIIEIETDYGQAFDKPLTLTVPVSTDPNTLPIPYYINPQGELELCQMTELDHGAGTMSFETWHASPYVVEEARLDNPLRENHDTGFNPERDGFQIGVLELQDYRLHGQLAMLCFADWYRRNAITQSGRLYTNFMEPIEGETGQFIIANRAHNSLLASFAGADRLALTQNLSLTPEQRWLKLRAALRQGPQIAVRRKGPTDFDYVMVVAYVGNDVFFYDTLSPGSVGEGSHNTGTHEVTLGAGTLENFFATGSLPFREPFSNIYADALQKFNNTSDAEITIESHTDGEVVNESKPKVTGKVDSGEYLIEEVWFINRTNSLKPPAIANVGLDGKFEVDLPLQQGENWFELVARAAGIGGKFHTVSSNFSYSDGFMLESTVQGGEQSEVPIFITVTRTTHLSTSLEDENVWLTVHVFDPDGEFSPKTGSESKTYDEEGGGGYLHSNPGYLDSYDVSFGSWDPPFATAWDGFGREHQLRVAFNKQSFGGSGPMGYEVKVYYNLVGPDPGLVALRDNPDSFEWESVDTLSGSIAEPFGPPWDLMAEEAPGLSEFHVFTPTEPLQ